MKIRALSVFATVIILLTVFSAGIKFLAEEEKKSDVPTDIKRIKDRGKLIVALVNDNVPPFFNNDNENPEGLDPALARDIAKEMGVKCEFNRSRNSWDETIELVANGTADIAVSQVSTSLTRATRIAFSDSYVTVNDALLVSRLWLAKFKDEWEDPIKILESKSFKLGVREGTYHADKALKEYPHAELVYYTGNSDEFLKKITDDFKQGKVMAVLSDDIDFRYWAKKYPEETLNILFLVRKEKQDRIAFVVNCKDTHLLYWLNLYLETIRGNGKYNELIGKYMKWKLEN